MLAALSDSDQDRNNLLGAAQALAEATAKLLNSSKPENIEVSVMQHVINSLLTCVCVCLIVMCIRYSYRVIMCCNL